MTERGTRLAEAFPAFAAELEALLRAHREPALADSIGTLTFFDRCSCGQQECESFSTAPPPEGSYGPGHRNISLTAPGTPYLILDVVDDQIKFIEILR